MILRFRDLFGILNNRLCVLRIVTRLWYFKWVICLISFGNGFWENSLNFARNSYFHNAINLPSVYSPTTADYYGGRWAKYKQISIITFHFVRDRGREHVIVFIWWLRITTSNELCGALEYYYYYYYSHKLLLLSYDIHAFKRPRVVE